MADSLRWMTRLGLLGMVCAALVACGSLDGTRDRVTRLVEPYRMDVVQGNVVTREQLAVLRPGMSRLQVRDILGTPLLTSMFHVQRWDYVFTMQRQGAETQARRVTVLFSGDVLERVEADPLPSEAEFAAMLDERRTTPAKPPELEASPQALEKFPPPPPTQSKPLPPLPVSYPPLEPATR